LATLDLSATDGVVSSIDITNINGNYGTLVLLVLNPLMASEGSSKALSIVIEAMFNSLDILVPSPKFIIYTQTPPTSQSGLISVATGLVDGAFSSVKDTIADGIDSMRQAVTSYTGLHNPNSSKIADRYIMTNRNFPNVVDSVQFFEKLDPNVDIDRIMQGPDFHTDIDEMDIQHIIGKPQYVRTIRLNAADSVGTLLFTRPISPFVGYKYNNSSAYFSNNIQLMHLLSRGWRGTINVHIQSVMNNKQQVKLRLLQLYNPSVEIAAGYPTYRTILNAPSHLMEFTAGGQIQTVSLPYLCRNKITPCMRDLNSESLFHGQFYIYVAQNLANSGGSPEDVYFNIYYSLGNDFKFYGYSTELLSINPVFKSETITSQSLEVMNEPQSQLNLVQNDQVEDSSEDFSDRLKPYKNMRDIIRRVYKLTGNFINIDKDTGVGSLIIPLRTVIMEQYSADILQSPLQAVLSMYYGKHLGLKFKLKMNSSSNLIVRYIPPNYFADSNTATMQGCTPLPATVENVDEFSNVPFHPVPFQEFPVSGTRTSNDTASPSLFEFTIPNTTFFKFLGGSDKMSNINTNLATSDMGHLLLTVSSKEVRSANEQSEIAVYVGATDESRLGFHCIAPIVFPAQTDGRSDTLYAGSFTTGNQQPDLTDNPFLYYTRI
jgi:hypothetical protein